MREAYITIHHALHTDVAVVTVNGVDYPILKAGNGCRYVWFEGIQIMQQNKHKSSMYAQRSRAGEKISWAMTQPSWTLIDDASIRLFSKKQETLPKIHTSDGHTNRTDKPTIQPGTQQPKPKTGKNRGTGNFWRSPQ